jgi:regulator of sigma E protease
MESLLGYGKAALILLEVIVIFNLLIVVHELGHFLAARWRGLVVEKFGIWFGKPLWKKTINGVEYSLGSIPAGGFVALPQMAPMEAIEGGSATDRAALPPVSPLDKIIVAFAGPLFSFMLALVFATLVWIVGKPVKQADSSLVIGYVPTESTAYTAGLRPGDRILDVDSRPVRMFNAMSDSVIWNVVSSEGPTIPVKVVRDGKEMTFNVEPTRTEQKGFGRSAKRQLAIDSAATPVIAQVKPGGAAEKAGFKPGDLVVAVEGKPVLGLNDIGLAQEAKPGQPVTVTVERKGHREDLLLPASPLRIRAVSKGAPAETAGLLADDVVLTADGRPATGLGFTRLAKEKVNHPILLTVQRGGEIKELAVTPLFEETNKKPMIGIAWAPDDNIGWDEYGIMTRTHPTPWAQVVETVRTMRNTFAALFSSKSELSFRDLGGPVLIGRTYFHLLNSEDGWRMALWFSVFMNVNLALLNMLPIPVLDGGHITLALIEMIRRKPVSIRVLEVVQTGCAVVIIGFMLYVTMFDVLDLPFLKRNRPASDLKFIPAEVSNAKANG